MTSADAPDRGRARVALRGIGWDHPRCMLPLRACAEAWSASRPDVAIVWDARPLSAFEDQPLEQIASRCDLLVIDHPFCGTAAGTGLLRPLDELLEPDVLARLARESVGPSHASYVHAGHQWAVAADAAAQVSAVAGGASGVAPASWADVLALARERPGRVGLPLAPAHALSSFLTLCANHGAPAAARADALAEPDVAHAVLAILCELAELGPRDALDWDPPALLRELTHADTLDYVPLTYGYVTYSTPGAVPAPCRFVDIPSAGHGPRGGMLGGAGLAVSGLSDHAAEAAAFAAWMAGAEAQRTLVAPAGGQPANRAAWEDPALDAAAGAFFSGTRATLEAAWVRPRARWWPAFQHDGGVALNAALRAGAAPDAIFERLQAIYLAARAGDERTTA